MGAAIASLALAGAKAIEPEIVAALAPITKELLAKLPGGTVSVVPPDIDSQVAVASQLQKAIPAFSASVFKTVTEKIGTAVALYDSEFKEGKRLVGLADDAAYIDVRSRAVVAISEEGIDTNMIPANLLRQMVSTGIVMYLAGNGAKALTV
jgi:hypothetical protein